MPASSTVHLSGPLTRAQELAYAAAVNLSAGDVRGLQAARHQAKPETADGPLGELMDRCDSAARGGVTGVSSTRFVHLSSRPIQSVSSGVYFFKSEARARGYLADAGGARFSACVKALASKAAEPIFSGPAVSALPAALPGVQIYGLRLTAHPALRGAGSGNSYTDLLSFVMGDTVVTLAATGEALPFPAAGERRLLAGLHARAQASSP